MLGYERFREQEGRSSFAIIIDIVHTVLSTGPLALDEQMVETFSRIFFGAVSSAGESVSGSEDPEAASLRVEAAIGFILMGLRSLVDEGIELHDPVTSPGAAVERLLGPRPE